MIKIYDAIAGTVFIGSHMSTPTITFCAATSTDGTNIDIMNYRQLLRKSCHKS